MHVGKIIAQTPNTGLSGSYLILTVVRIGVNKVNKTWLMQGHLKHLHISKEVLTRHHGSAHKASLQKDPRPLL